MKTTRTSWTDGWMEIDNNYNLLDMEGTRGHKHNKHKTKYNKQKNDDA